MHKDKKQPIFMNIGLSSLMVVFLSLCLVTFAMLTLATAKNDYDLSQKMASRKSNYYAASSEASVLLDRLDAILEESYNTNSSDYTKELAAKLSNTAYTLSSEDSQNIITYQVPIDEEQFLLVEAALTDPSKNEHYYRILTWKVVASEDWEADNSLNLIEIK